MTSAAAALLLPAATLSLSFLLALTPLRKAKQLPFPTKKPYCPLASLLCPFYYHTYLAFALALLSLRAVSSLREAAVQIRALLRQAVTQLKDHSFESPRLEAELLMMHVTKLNKVQLITRDQEELPALDETVYRALLEQRLQGQPIAYILGERDFWDLSLKVSPDTLIPRPDTEILVEKALTLIKCNHCRDVLDLGTGSGAIILSLKHDAPEIRASAVDISPAALAVAAENAARYNLEVSWYCGSWFSPFMQPQAASALATAATTKAKDIRAQHTSCTHHAASSGGAATTQGEAIAQFDLIVANPPYIEEGDPHLQQGDVRFEPLVALVSGQDGLSDIKLIVHESRAFLRQGGYLALEHGYNQGEAVRHLFKTVGYTQVETLRDYGQNERVTLGRALS